MAKSNEPPCRVAVTSKGRTIDSDVTSVNRGPYFLIFEGKPENPRVVENKAIGKGTEAGVAAASLLKSLKINIVITGTLGSKGFRALNDAGIVVHAGCKGTISDAIRKCMRGELEKCKGARFAGTVEL